MSKRRKTPATSPRAKVVDVFVARPFAGLVDEPDWVALRELVPAASAPLRLAADVEQDADGRRVILSTVLPAAMPALVKPDGRVFIGLQRQVQSGDASRDLAAALLAALRTAPGERVDLPPLPGPGPRLQDVLADGALAIDMHEGFDYWLDEGATDDPAVMSSLERANAAIYPTVRMQSARAAYWSRVTDKAHVRWVLAEAEDQALAALARLASDSALALGDGTRFAGMFRAHGLLVPVWDVPREREAAEWESALADVAKRYAEALADGTELTAAQRRAKQGLLGRQITLR